MPINFGRHGLEYTHDLCAAIEQYTATKVENKPHAYVYRGMQLRYAVERWLYIQCINSEALFSLYMRYRKGIYNFQEPRDLKGFELDIAFFLVGTKISFMQVIVRRARWLLKLLQKNYNCLGVNNKSFQDAESEPEKSGILIHVINAKFAKYLEPVIANLAPGSYSFLNANDPKLGELLSKSGYPVKSYAGESYAKQQTFNYDLSEFTQLVQDVDVLYAALKQANPKCVIVVEGNAPSDIITSEICRSLGVPCYCVQHGWSPYVHNGFRNMNFTEMFVWGPKFAELLQPFNPKQAFRVTGAQAVARQDRLPAREHIETLGFFLQAPCALLGMEAYETFVEMIIKVSIRYPQLNLIVRSHPGYPLSSELKAKLSKLENVHISVPEDEQVAKVILASDLVISVFSTVLLEAMAMGVVPLICSIGAIQKYQPDLASSGAAIEVHSVSEALQVLDKIIAEPELLANIKKQIQMISNSYFSDADGAKAISTYLKNNEVSSSTRRKT